jgi:hypothetical protein
MPAKKKPAPKKKKATAKAAHKSSAPPQNKPVPKTAEAGWVYSVSGWKNTARPTSRKSTGVKAMVHRSSARPAIKAPPIPHAPQAPMSLTDKVAEVAALRAQLTKLAK